MSVEYILIIFCVLVVCSYLFNIIAQRFKIPSVILLLGTGVLLKQAAVHFQLEIPNLSTTLAILGNVGLIMIVLEGALELKINRNKKKLIGQSLLSAFLVLIVTVAGIVVVNYLFLDLSMRQSLAYAVPLGVISSAIAIPSVQNINIRKKEFITYESTFSDILGILIFNYVISDDLLSWFSVGHFFMNIGLILIISVISTIFLLFILNYIRSSVKFFLILSLLIFVYASGKLIHLPSLMLILIFGLILGNIRPFIRGRLAKFLQPERLKTITNDVFNITVETAFMIRTFFFITLGFTINLSQLSSAKVILTGTMILIVIFSVRYLFLRFISKTNVFPELFIAPRGLITILLFFSIPASLQNDLFDEGILIFVILGSSIVMMLGLLFFKESYSEEIATLEQEPETDKKP